VNTAHERWIAAQPPAVAAVLVLAELDPPERAIIAAGLLPGHADDVEHIADRLAWVDRFDSDVPADVLGDWFECPVIGASIETCERLAQECRAEALTAAQLVASLLPVARAA
jgi:hypothetical protein